jgi:hypothetical protein
LACFAIRGKANDRCCGQALFRTVRHCGFLNALEMALRVGASTSRLVLNLDLGIPLEYQKLSDHRETARPDRIGQFFSTRNIRSGIPLTIKSKRRGEITDTC